MSIMFIGTNIEPYGMTNWIYSYEYGFSKRALMGTIFRLVVGNNLSFEDFKSWIIIFHKIAIALFFVLIIIAFNLTDRSLFSVISFVVFLTSMFVRNDFSLVGFVDIWITNLLLLALILFLTNHNILFFIILIISGLVHELTIFFIPAISVFYLLNGITKTKVVYLIGSLVTCLIIIFISGFFYDKDTLKSILSIYPELYSKDHIELVTNVMLKHYSVIELIKERLEIIIKYINNELFAFIYYGFTSLVLLFITFQKLKKEVSYRYKLLIFVVVMFPCVVTFIATDLWRVASFYIFTIFIIYVCCNRMQLIEKGSAISNKYLKYLLLFSFLFQCFIPFICLSRENTGFSSSNYCRYNKIVEDTFFYDLAKLIVFNYTYKDEYKSYSKEGPYSCSYKGNKSLSLILYPGMNRVKIYSTFNQNGVHSIGINSQEIIIDNKIVEFSIYQTMDRAVRGASNLYCLPSSEDWEIDKIEVNLIE